MTRCKDDEPDPGVSISKVADEPMSKDDQLYKPALLVCTSFIDTLWSLPSASRNSILGPSLLF